MAHTLSQSLARWAASFEPERTDSQLIRAFLDRRGKPSFELLLVQDAGFDETLANPIS